MPNSPFIVAEISCNHLGDLQRAIALIEAAKGAGADAVKFQCWHPGRMSIDDAFVLGSGPWKGYTLPQLYEEAFTPWHWFPILFERAKSIGIECFSSVFDIEALSFLERLHCPRYKISSFEITDLPLIEAVAKTGKPLVISTGMASEDEVTRAWNVAEQAGLENITLLKCTSAYPATATSANLATMDQLGYYAGYCGLSDHTLGSTVAIAATVLGATMIEKHLTLKRADGGPDAGFSSEPHEFRQMVDACREAALALGVVHYGPTEAEKPSLIYRRSLYARKQLHAGMELTPALVAERIQSSRPALGLPPSYPITGCTMARDVPAGSPIQETDLAR